MWHKDFHITSLLSDQFVSSLLHFVAKSSTICMEYLEFLKLRNSFHNLEKKKTCWKCKINKENEEKKDQNLLSVRRKLSLANVISNVVDVSIGKNINFATININFKRIKL